MLLYVDIILKKEATIFNSWNTCNLSLYTFLHVQQVFGIPYSNLLEIKKKIEKQENAFFNTTLFIFLNPEKWFLVKSLELNLII